MSQDDEVMPKERRWSEGARERKPDFWPSAEEPDEALDLTLSPEPDEDDPHYQALRLHKRPTCLHIIRATLPSRLPSYSYLMDVSYDHHHHSALKLFYSFMSVQLIGEHLYTVMHAIKYRHCDTIRQFDKNLHKKPISGQPIIYEIEIKLSPNMADPLPPG